ncbi:hypothetical protein FACS1894161_1710 [Spirochaetia bacterium]|nr:hypothetical protein FACS1894161_1710 [Spirochaetia bacterium]
MNPLIIRFREDINAVVSFFSSLAKKYRTFNAAFDDKTIGRKKGIRVYIFLSTLYITLAAYFMNSHVFSDSVRTAKSLISSLFLVILFYVLLKLVCLKTYNLYFQIYGEKKPLNETSALYTSLFCFIFFFILFLVNFPCAMTTDNLSQWYQIQSFSFSDWHPVIHTFAMWILSRIINHYSFIIFCQVLIFSFSLGLLAATMEAWGFPRSVLLCMTIFFVLNPMVKNILMFAYKDTFFTILITFLTSALINIYFSGGKWLSSINNILKVSICLAFLSIARHNGILFTLPLGILLLIFYLKNNLKALLIIPFTLTIVFFVRYPLYSALHVSYPNNAYMESLGVPMTIMCDVVIKNPDSMPEDARNLLLDFDKKSDWIQKYELGNFSPAKPYFVESGIITSLPKRQFLRMVFGTILGDPYNSFQAFRNHSAFVWEIFTVDNSIISAPWKQHIAGETNRIKKAIMYLSVFYDNSITSVLPLGWLFARNGWQILILIMAGMIAFYRIGEKSLALVIPILFYTFSTMMLLSASDLRYFQFNSVIVFPLVLTLLSRKEIPDA